MVTRFTQLSLMAALAGAIAFTGSITATAQDDAQNGNQSEEQKQQDEEQQQQDEKSQEQSDQESDEAQQEPKELKAFELKHREPGEIQKLAALGDQSPTAGKRAKQFVRGQQRTSFYRGAPQKLVLAADDESGILFARGTSDQIEQITKVIDAVDKPADELEGQSIENARLIPVTKEQGANVRRVLSQLQLPHEMVGLSDGGFIIVCHGESDEQKAEAKQVEEVISKITANQKQDQSKESGEQAKADQESEGQQEKEQDESQEDSSDN